MIYKRFNAIVARAFVRVEAKEALLRRDSTPAPPTSPCPLRRRGLDAQ
jgi:hypothetical protein